MLLCSSGFATISQGRPGVKMVERTLVQLPSFPREKPPHVPEKESLTILKSYPTAGEKFILKQPGFT